MNRMHAGDLVVEQDGRIRAMVAGDVIVRPGVRAQIDAMIGGDLIVEEGADVSVRGMVGGRVIGAANVTGMVGSRH